MVILVCSSSIVLRQRWLGTPCPMSPPIRAGRALSTNAGVPQLRPLDLLPTSSVQFLYTGRLDLLKAGEYLPFSFLELEG